MSLKVEDFKDEEKLKELIYRVNKVIKSCDLASKAITSETVNITNVLTRCMLTRIADTFDGCRDILEGMGNGKKVTK